MYSDLLFIRIVNDYLKQNPNSDEKIYTKDIISFCNQHPDKYPSISAPTFYSKKNFRLYLDRINELDLHSFDTDSIDYFGEQFLKSCGHPTSAGSESIFEQSRSDSPNFTANLIRNHAKEKGMSIRQLALKAGLNYPSLFAALKRSSGYISNEMLSKVAATLGVSPQYLRRGSENIHYLSEAEIELQDTIEFILGDVPDDQRESKLLLINSFLEANGSLINLIFDKLQSKGG